MQCHWILQKQRLCLYQFDTYFVCRDGKSFDFYSSVINLIVLDLHCLVDLVVKRSVSYILRLTQFESVGNCNSLKIVRLVWFETIYILLLCILYCEIIRNVYLEILNINLNPKKSSDFFSLFVDFTIYIVKSTDFFNICEPNIIQIVYFLVLEDSGGLYLFGIIWLFHELCSSSS